MIPLHPSDRRLLQLIDPIAQHNGLPPEQARTIVLHALAQHPRRRTRRPLPLIRRGEYDR